MGKGACCFTERLCSVSLFVLTVLSFGRSVFTKGEVDKSASKHETCLHHSTAGEDIKHITATQI